MRVLMVFAGLVAMAVAYPGYSGSGSFSSSGSSGWSQSVDSYAAPQPSGGDGPYGKGPNIPQPPVIHKHVYVHVPPPEPEVYVHRKPIHVPAPQKHYKIVFIKAPAPPAPTAPVIPQFAQDEQKTLIYVLVKKPEEAPEIDIQPPAPTKPSKPEVYFIRYKTQKEAAPQYGAPPPSSYGAPSGPSIPDTSYGGPAPQPGPSSNYGAPSH